MLLVCLAPIGASEDQSAAVRELLAWAFETQLGSPLPALRKTDRGKPYLADSAYHLSLSHTRGCVACAVSDRPVGVDVERVRPVRDGLPARVLSPKEFAAFQAQGSTLLDFFTLWTLKESYYKMTGSGLAGIPNRTDFVWDTRWSLPGCGQQFSVVQGEGWVLAVCGSEPLDAVTYRT